MSDQPDLSGLYASVTVEGHSFEVKSPAAVLVPANTLHHYKLTGGSGWYFHVNLRCDYEDSLSEPDSVDPSQIPDVDVSAIYKTGVKGPDTESESSPWSFVDDRFSKPGIHIRVYQIGSEMQDEIHRVFERGDGASLPVAAPGESLEVEVQSGDHFVKGISPATIYHSGGDAFTYSQVRLPAVPLTIMADSTLASPPVWISDGSRHLRVYNDLTVRGIRFDGQGRTETAIRNFASEPNKIVIESCEISRLKEDGISSRSILDTCIVRNTIFHDIERVGIDFLSSSFCRNLVVENATFYRIGEHAVHMFQKSEPLKVRISNVTVHDCLTGIHLIDVTDVVVSNSIITKSLDYAVQVPASAVLTNLCTSLNRRDFRHGGDKSCFQADPRYLDAEEGDFSLLPDSPCLTTAGDGGAIGDLRWSGVATIRAGRWDFVRSLGRGAGILLVVAIAIYVPIRYIRYHTRRREEELAQEALEKAHEELEIRVDERTAELKILNEKLLDEIANRVRVENARKRAEQELETQHQLKMRSDRLRSLGEMAAGIAHELNQPLVGVRGMAEHTLIGLDKGWDLSNDKLRERMDGIVEQADRMVHIIQQVRMFAREAGKPDLSEVAVNDVVISSIEMIGAQFSFHDLGLTTDLSDNLPPVLANPYSLEEVVLNLLNNALHATEDRRAVDQAYTRSRVVVRTTSNGRNVHIQMEDNGCGIPEEAMAKIFDPFFTTKDPDKGTGLGMSISKSIVEKFGGTLHVDSTLGQGTTVTIVLPEGKLSG